MITIKEGEITSRETSVIWKKTIVEKPSGPKRKKGTDSLKGQTMKEIWKPTF